MTDRRTDRQTVTISRSACISVLTRDKIKYTNDSGVGVRLKVGINIGKSEGVGSGEGLLSRFRIPRD